MHLDDLPESDALDRKRFADRLRVAWDAITPERKRRLIDGIVRGYAQDGDPIGRRLPDSDTEVNIRWSELSRKVGGDLFDDPAKLETMRAVDRAA